MSDQYSAALSDACGGFEALKPPTRMSVSQGAAANLEIQQPGAPKTRWKASETPYLVHPMDSLASRLHEATVYVGPARTGKTAGLLLGWSPFLRNHVRANARLALDRFIASERQPA